MFENKADKNDAGLKNKLKEIFDKFRSQFVSATFDEKDSSATISLQGLSEAKQKELGALLWSLIEGKASMSTKFDVEIVLTSSEATGKTFIKHLFAIIIQIRNLHNEKEQAYTQGAAGGALSNKLTEKELGAHVGSFLDRTAGGRLAQTSREARHDAEEARTKKTDEISKRKSGP